MSIEKKIKQFLFVFIIIGIAGGCRLLYSLKKKKKPLPTYVMYIKWRKKANFSVFGNHIHEVIFTHKCMK